MSFGTESAGDILCYVHAVATLVVQHDTVAAGRHPAVHTEGSGFVICYASVIAVKADA